MGYTGSSLDVPRNYAEAKRWFDGRRDKHRNFRNLEGTQETSVRCYEQEGTSTEYAIRLYATDIITYHEDGRVWLDNYDSNTTNDRRDRAGMPVIRSAQSTVGRSKAERLVVKERWAFYGGPVGGMPADSDLALDSTGTAMFDPESTEGVYVLDETAAKERRALVKWFRKDAVPLIVAKSALGDHSFINWAFTAEALRELQLVATQYGLISGAFAKHLDAFIKGRSAFVGFKRTDGLGPTVTEDALRIRLSELAPAKNMGEEGLWNLVQVKTVDLAEVLGV